MRDEVFVIPLLSGEGEVELPANDLPEKEVILEVLKTERPPLQLWRAIAVGYFKKGDGEAFEEILKLACSDEIMSQYDDFVDERIVMLNCLASYYTQIGVRENDEAAKRGHFAQAVRYFNQVDSIDPHCVMTLVGKGVLELERGETDGAYVQFDNALSIDQENVPALLGMACIFFHRGDALSALSRYQTALRLHPNCCAEIRLGIGLCMYKLGHEDRAREAFERTLQLNPRCEEALVALALLSMNNTDLSAQERVRQSMQYLERAWRLTKTNAMVLNHLSNYFFLKSNFQKVQDMAPRAFKSTHVPQIRAESMYFLARAYHAVRDYSLAFHYYNQSTAQWMDFPLAHFGLGQMYLERHQYGIAIDCFEKVAKFVPENYETTLVLGVLYSKTGDTAKAIKYVETVTELWPGEVNGWLEYARQLEPLNPAKCAEAYERAVRIVTKSGDSVGFELWNNLGAARHRVGNFKGAEEAFRKSLKLSDSLTVQYNIARVLEEQRRLNEAEELYLAILKRFPNYLDCHLRLGVMARERGDTETAVERFREAITIEEDNCDAWALWGNLHFAKGEWGLGRGKFGKIHEFARNDAYAVLAKERVSYHKIKHLPEDRRLLESMLANSRKVLKDNPSNVYAANMCGVAIAELGHTDIAARIFQRIREVSNNMPEVLINLAHISLNNGDHDKAISLYTSCQRRFFHNHNIGLHRYTALAHLEENRTLECVRTFTKALHLAPQDATIRYNLAIAQYNHCARLLKSKHSPCAEFSAALTMLGHAEISLSHLLAVAKKPIKKEDVSIYLEKCKFVGTKLGPLRDQAEARERRADELRQEKLEEARKAALLEQLRREEEERKKEAQAAHERERLRQQRERLARLQAQVEEGRAQRHQGGEGAESGGKRKRRKGIADMIPDEEIVPASELRKESSEGESDSDDDGNPSKRPRLVQEEGDSDNDLVGGLWANTNPDLLLENPLPEATERALFGSDDDDDDEDNDM